MYGSTENACPELEHLQFGPTGVYLKYHWRLIEDYP